MIKHKYQQLFDLLEREFHCGRWPNGSKLPNLKELASEYSVSVNVVSQTIELLKQASLVKVKLGSGIYSTFSPATHAESLHYSGKRLFGQYAGAKKLSILVEDNLPWQTKFWGLFFNKFTNDNPDIELDIRHGYQTFEEPQERFTMAIGGERFLSLAISRMPDLMPCKEAAAYYPHLYDNCFLKTSDIGNFRFPFGFTKLELLALEGLPEALPNENNLDYVERVGSVVQGGYCIKSIAEFLEHTGCPLKKLGKEALTKDERKYTLDVLTRIKKMYGEGRFLWFHGQFVNKEEQIEWIKNRRISALEYSANMRQQYPVGGSLRAYSLPDGGNPLIIPLAAQINSETCFYEECLRVIESLLSSETQRNAANAGIFYPILKSELDCLRGPCKNSFLEGRYRLRELGNQLLEEAKEYCLGWEIFYYLENRRGSEILDILEHKFSHYYKYRKNQESVPF